MLPANASDALNADWHEPGAADIEASQKREFEHADFRVF